MFEAENFEISKTKLVLVSVIGGGASATTGVSRWFQHQLKRAELGRALQPTRRLNPSLHPIHSGGGELELKRAQRSTESHLASELVALFEWEFRTRRNATLETRTVLRARRRRHRESPPEQIPRGRRGLVLESHKHRSSELAPSREDQRRKRQRAHW